MNRFIVSVLILCALVPCATSIKCLAAVIGEDDRNSPEAVFSQADRSRYNQIGVLLAEGAAVTTATITLAGNVVTGAAHAFVEEGHWKTDWRNVRFRIGVSDKLTRNTRDFELDGRPVVGTMDPQREPANDWAVAKLKNFVVGSNPLMVKTSLELGPSNLGASNDRTVILLAFMKDIEKGAVARRMDCPFLDKGYSNTYVNSREIRIYECDTDAGSSGGPLILRDGNEDYLIGVNSGYVTIGPNRPFNSNYNFNYGISIGRDFAQAICQAADLSDCSAATTEPREAN